MKQSGATSNKNLFLNRSFRSNRRRANLRGLVSIFPPFLLPLTQETSPRFHERYDFRETSKKIARCDSRVNVPRRNHGCDRTSEPLRGNLVIYLRPGPNSQTKCIQRSATKSGIDFHRISLLFFHSLSPLPPPVSVQRVFRHPFSRPSPPSFTSSDRYLEIPPSIPPVPTSLLDRRSSFLMKYSRATERNDRLLVNHPDPLSPGPSVSSSLPPFLSLRFSFSLSLSFSLSSHHSTFRVTEGSRIPRNET